MPYSILLVDDDPDIDKFARLWENRGHVVIQYYRSEDLREDLRDGIDYQVAIVDRSLSEFDGDGDQIMAELKEKYPNRPIICLSGWGTSEAKPRISHADMYLEKGFPSPNRIIGYIEDLLKP